MFFLSFILPHVLLITIAINNSNYIYICVYNINYNNIILKYYNILFCFSHQTVFTLTHEFYFLFFAILLPGGEGEKLSVWCLVVGLG